MFTANGISLQGYGQTRSAALEKFQQALEYAGFKTGEEPSGYTWALKMAMNGFQQAQGFELTDYPDAKTLDALGLAPEIWPNILQDAGAPEERVTDMETQVGRTVEPDRTTEPEALPTTSPAAASAVGAKGWLKKHWPKLVGGTLLGTAAVVLVVAATKEPARRPAA